MAADNASAGLLAVLKVADVGKLERAVEQAQRAEVERDLLSQGSTALRHARALRQAAEGQDLARLEAALETWSDWVAPDRRDGPDFWAARRAYQVLKAEATAAPYRSGASSRPTSARPGTAASSRNGGGGSAFASRPASARPATASTSASRPTSAAPYVSRPATATGASRSREGGYNQQRPVSASAGSLYSPGGSPRRERGQPYTYDQWVHDKAEQARRSKAEAEEMKRRWRDKVELERRRREAEQASNRMRERGWPDLQYEPVPFGAYATEPSRLESVRMTYNMLSMSQVYSRPQSAANSGGSPRRRTTSERQPYDSSAAYDDNDGGGGDDVNIVRYNADGSASASRPSTAAHSRPAAAAAGERSGDAAGGGGSAGSGNMQEEASPLSMMEYRLVVTTGKQLGAGTDAEVYFVLHGEQGETQKAKLPATSAQLEGGSVDTFSLTLPYVGPLTHLTLGHDGRGFAAAWLCDKVEVTEERTGRRYNFVCGEWLKGNKLETRLPVSSVDTTSLSETSSSPRQPPPPSPPPPQQQQQSSLSPRSPPSSTSATAAGGVANDGQLLAAPSPTSPPSPAPSPGSHAAPRPTSATTTSSSRPMSGSGRPMSAVAKAASAPLSRKPPCTYKITIKTTDKTTDVPVTGTDASVFVELGGPDGSSGRMPLACNTSRAQSTALLFDTGNLAELAVVANHVGQLAWVRVGHDGVGVRPRWHVAYVDVYDPVVGVTYHCPCRDWLDAARGDGRIERMLTPVVGKITNNGGGSTWGAPGAIDEYEAEIPEDVDDD